MRSLQKPTPPKMIVLIVVPMLAWRRLFRKHVQGRLVVAHFPARHARQYDQVEVEELDSTTTASLPSEERVRSERPDG